MQEVNYSNPSKSPSDITRLLHHLEKELFGFLDAKTSPKTNPTKNAKLNNIK